MPQLVTQFPIFSMQRKRKKKNHDAYCSSSSYTSLRLKTIWLVTALAGSVVQIVWDDEMHTCNSSQSIFTHITREVHLLC